MKNSILIIVIQLFFFIACSSTEYLSRGQSSYEMLNEELTGTSSKIELVDGRIVSANNFQINNDTLRWREKERILNVVRLAPDSSKMPTAKIQKITCKKTGLGMLEGAGFGIVAGIFIGTLMAKSEAEEEPDDVGDAMFGKPMAVSAAAYGGLGLGIAVGAVIGAIIGHRNHYVFTDSDTTIIGYKECGNSDPQSH